MKKLIWKEKTIWNKLPMVLIAEALQKQKWFKGEIKYNPNRANKMAKECFEKNMKNGKNWGLRGPSRLYVIQKHKGVEMEVRITWDTIIKRCDIYLDTPITLLYQPNGSYNNPKPVCSKYLEGVLERIKKAFEHGIPAVENEILAKEARKIKEKKAREYKENLSDELGVNLTSVPYYQNTYRYGKNKAFNLSFQRTSLKKEDEFEITEIEGVFGRKEIKELIKIIGGNPRAIASRLTNK